MINKNIIIEEFKKINGVNLYFKTIGEGIPIVIVHGGPGLAHNYLYNYFSELSDQYKLIFYDQRACGLSSGEEFEENISIDNYVEDIEEIRKVFNINEINLIGQSYGGIISLSYAVKYPKNMKSLILVESAGITPKSDLNFEANLDKRMTNADKKKLSYIEKRITIETDKGIILQEYFMILFKYYFFDMNFVHELNLCYLTDKMVEKLFLCGRLLKHNSELLALLTTINCPTLIMHGDFDPTPVEDIQIVHEAIENSEFIILKNCGHFAHIEQNKQYFNTIRRFYFQNLI